MNTNRLIGVVLAGGASRRMGGEPKALMDLNGETMLARAVARLEPQVGRVLVNAPDEATYQKGDRTIVNDPFPDRKGPLAGVLAAMSWAEANDPEALGVISVAVDTPLFPTDLAERLMDGWEPAGIAIARAGGRPQPTFGLWPIEALERLRSFLMTSETLKIMDFVEDNGVSFVDFEDEAAFENINTPDDLEALRTRLG